MVYHIVTSSLNILYIYCDDAHSEEELDGILDNPEYMAIINASGWPLTRCIDLASKSSLLQGLIMDELIIKRSNQVAAFRKGLQHFGLLELCKKHPSLSRELFTASSKHLNADAFLALVD